MMKHTINFELQMKFEPSEGMDTHNHSLPSAAQAFQSYVSADRLNAHLGDSFFAKAQHITTHVTVEGEDAIHCRVQGDFQARTEESVRACEGNRPLFQAWDVTFDLINAFEKLTQEFNSKTQESNSEQPYTLSLDVPAMVDGPAAQVVFKMNDAGSHEKPSTEHFAAIASVIKKTPFIDRWYSSQHGDAANDRTPMTDKQAVALYQRLEGAFRESLNGFQALGIYAGDSNDRLPWAEMLNHINIAQHAIVAYKELVNADVDSEAGASVMVDQKDSLIDDPLASPSSKQITLGNG